MPARACRCMPGNRRSFARMQSGSEEPSRKTYTCSEALASCASHVLLRCSLSARVDVVTPSACQTQLAQSPQSHWQQACVEACCVLQVCTYAINIGDVQRNMLTKLITKA